MKKLDLENKTIFLEKFTSSMRSFLEAKLHLLGIKGSIDRKLGNFIKIKNNTIQCDAASSNNAISGDYLMNMHLFDIGDIVRVIQHGYGCGINEVGMEVQITSYGKYVLRAGYKVSPAIGNTATGQFDGIIAENSFEFVSGISTKIEDEETNLILLSQ